jgi:hypothetical protein
MHGRDKNIFEVFVRNSGGKSSCVRVVLHVTISLSKTVLGKLVQELPFEVII